MSSEIAEEKLFKLVEGNPTRFLSKWVNNDSRETEVLLERAISINSIRKNLNVYKYGSDIIGRSKEEAIQFLDNPTNQDIKRSILIELDARNTDTTVKSNIKTNIQQILEEPEVEPEVVEKEIEPVVVEVPKPKTKKKLW
jgi:hypothetical protein